MPPSTVTAASEQQAGMSAGGPLLPLTVRLADGRETTTSYPAKRHRAIHLGLLHCFSKGLVEVGAGRRDSKGELHIYTRRRPRYFLPAGGSGDDGWRAPALALADRHLQAGDELFLGVAPRTEPRGSKQAVQWSEWLWVDIDGPEHLGRLQALLERKPAHLLVESAGSGGMHAYWRLSRPLPAREVTSPDGSMIVNPLEVREPTGVLGYSRLVGYRARDTEDVVSVASKVDWIERANLRLIHALGYTQTDGQPVPVADRQCRDQNRLLRWAGSVNGKTGRWSRIVRLDLWLPPYSPKLLLGDLEDPPRSRPVQKRDLRRHSYDAYRLIPAAVYFPRIAGRELAERGNINCPSPLHPDEKASCSVDAYVFHCFGCGAHGTLYDLQSLMLGGPAGDALAADQQAFKTAVRAAQEACADLL
jgi:hypothetical protein